MLTGDENIVDVDFTVLWRIKPKGAADFLFNIQNPEEHLVKAVAESAMREAASARPTSKPILTGARHHPRAERASGQLMQKTLDNYGSGHRDHPGADAEGRSARCR